MRLTFAPGGATQQHIANCIDLTKSAEGRSPTRKSPQSSSCSAGAALTTNMLDNDRSRLRKERTFAGGRCAVCELPLEHKLKGEKVLQFTCGHVVHEACLYEFINGEDNQICPECGAALSLDTSRGGNILDLSKLTSMVRSIAQAPGEVSPGQSNFNVNKSWDGSTLRERENGNSDAKALKTLAGGRHRLEQLAGNSLHTRQQSNGTPPEQIDSDSADGRLHDYDLSRTESKLKTHASTQNIPRPNVTIRSEFPTLTRSTQKQSLTCLVTVEVPAARSRVRQIGGAHPLSSAPMLTSETPQALAAVAADLKARVDNWHGLEVDKFGPLRLHTNLKVGRDGTNWQKLDVFLFSELLICVREKKATPSAKIDGKPKYQLKGSILVRKHLKDVGYSADDLTLTLNLTVNSLPEFRLKFSSREQLDVWRLALVRLEVVAPILYGSQDEQDASGAEDNDTNGRPSSASSRKTTSTEQTDYAGLLNAPEKMSTEIHVPVDFVVVMPVSQSMQGLKIKLIKDALRFLLLHLGERDRLGLVTFGSNGGVMPLVGMATKDWSGWRDVYRSIKPVGTKSLRAGADTVEGANVAMDLLSQRKVSNPISSILLISDAATKENESMDFVVKRAQEAKVSIYSFGLGQTHKPDNLIELSSRTNGSYVYVKNWMVLRECVAGCLGSLQSTSHMAAKLKLKIPEGAVAKFVKVSGALHVTKRSNGREAEAVLGDLRFGDKRDILVQLSVDPDTASTGDSLQDHWETIVTGLATLGGSLEDNEPRPQSVEELPLLQADLSFGDFAKAGALARLSQPSLLTITTLPGSPRGHRNSKISAIPMIPSHPSIIQRRMEMLTSDMLTRALTLASKSQHDNAHRLLAETRTILQGLGKGSLPPLPPLPPLPVKSAARSSSAPKLRSASPKPQSLPVKDGSGTTTPATQPSSGRSSPKTLNEKTSNQSLPCDFSSNQLSRSPPPPPPPPARAAATIDSDILHALDTDIEACMEFITHPAVFSHDARKSALQTIAVISSQRAFTFRTETESLWAGRISGVKKMGDIAKEWKMIDNDTLQEEL